MPKIMSRDVHVVVSNESDLPLKNIEGDDQLVILWNSFSVPDSLDPTRTISLPQYIETNGDRLRERILSFINQIGSSEIDGRTVIEHLIIAPNFSYWWMTLFACKRWNDSSRLIDAVKLIAFEEVLLDKKISKISVSNNDFELKTIIKEWCQSNSFNFHDISAGSRHLGLRETKAKLIPPPIKAIIALVRAILNRRELGLRQHLVDTEVDTLFIDHFSRFNTKSAEHGEFVSGFWEPLLGHGKESRRTVFLHNFVRTSDTPRLSVASDLIRKLNSNSDNRQHQLLDSPIGLRTMIHVLAIYLRLFMARFRVRKVRDQFTPLDSDLNLWPLFKGEWRDSLSGSTAINHSILIADIERFSDVLPSCNRIIYLMENQPWEMAVLQIFMNRRQETLIGYPHSTIRFWDLRYWTAKHNSGLSPFAPQPTPHQVAANGPHARLSLESSGFRFQGIVDVEALSYLYLEHPDKLIIDDSRQRLLVLGDFFPTQNRALLELLGDVDAELLSRFQITFKAHPLCQVDGSWMSALKMKTDIRPLAEQLRDCDIVLSTNGTSASAEAYQFGARVITILNGNTPNFSPLRDTPGAHFVSSSKELEEALEIQIVSPSLGGDDYFWVDNSLARWRNLLSIE